MISDVKKVQNELETMFIKEVENNDQRVAELDNDTRVVNELNRFCNLQADRMMRSWKELDNFLIVKYIDGNVKQETNGKFETTETGVVKYPSQPGYPQWFYGQIVKDHGTMIKDLGSK